VKKAAFIICLVFHGTLALAGAAEKSVDVEIPNASPPAIPQTPNLGDQTDNSLFNSGDTGLENPQTETTPHPAIENTPIAIPESDSLTRQARAPETQNKNAATPKSSQGTSPTSIQTKILGTQKSKIPSKQTSSPNPILNSGAEEIGALQNAKAQDVLALQSTLRKIFDRDISKQGNGPKAGPPPIHGKTENFFDKVYQTATIAVSASPYDAPGLFRSALIMTKEAQTKHEIKPQIATALKKTLITAAFKKAEESLPLLLKETAQAAMDSERKTLERGLKAFVQWEDLLNAPQKPLIANGKSLAKYLDNLLSNSENQPYQKRIPISSNLRLKKLHGQFKAVLPPFSVGEIPVKALGQNGALSLDGNLPFLISDKPGIFSTQSLVNWDAFYQLERKTAGQSAFEAGSRATLYSGEIAAQEFWNWVLSLISQLKAPTSVDLGNDLSIRSHNPNYKNLILFKREMGQGPEMGTVFLDLSSINRPYFDFKRTASFKSAEDLAAAYQKLSGDSSGVKGLADLSQKLKEPRKTAGAPELSAYWTQKIYDSALVFLFQALKRGAENSGKTAIFADIGTSDVNGMIFVASENQALIGLLKKSGFDIETLSPWNYALISRPNKEMRKILHLTQGIMSGQITSLPQRRAAFAQTLDAPTKASLDQALKAYATGLKDDQALMNWWDGYSKSPQALSLAQALAADIIARSKSLAMPEKSVSKILKAVTQSLPQNQQKAFLNSLKALKHKAKNS
jgi:hypothetical protein